MIGMRTKHVSIPLPVVVLVVALAGAGVLGVGVTVYTQQQRASTTNAPITLIRRWASAAEQGDTATMLGLMPANDLQTAFWRDAWSSAYRAKRIAPGYAISALETHGATTTAIVHFKQNASAMSTAYCERVEVVNEQITTPGRPYDCAFPASPVLP